MSKTTTYEQGMYESAAGATHMCPGGCLTEHEGWGNNCPVCEDCPDCRMNAADNAQQDREELARRTEEVHELRTSNAGWCHELGVVSEYLGLGYPANHTGNGLVREIRALRRRDRIRTALITGVIGLAAVALALML